MKILAIKTRSLGDTVLMTAPLQELSAAFPQAQIHILIKPEWAPLLEGNPSIHKIWKFESPSNLLSRTAAIARLAFQLRQENYDWVINFHASSSSALLALATGAKARSVHFHGHSDPNRYSTVEIPGKGTLKPIIERDMDALRALKIHIPAGRSPQITLQISEHQRAETWMKEMNLSSPILALGLGASRPTKCWPIERFASLAVEWVLNNQGSILAFAGSTEEVLIHSFLKAVDELLSAYPQLEVRANIRGKILTTHTLEIRTLAALLSRVSVLVGNDSGPKHLAISVGTPTVTLFGPEHPFEWHPYSPDRHPYFFIEALPCRREGKPGMPAWCGISKCTLEEHRCMRLIGVDAVLAACQRVAKKEGR